MTPRRTLRITLGIVVICTLLLSILVIQSQGIPIQNQIEKIIADPSTTTNPLDLFGLDIAIDGNTMVTSAIFNDTTETDGGLLYVYDYDDVLEDWQFTTTLAVSNTGSFRAELGETVDIDGDIIVSGAAGVDDTMTDEGRFYIFERTNGVWDTRTTIEAPEPQVEGFFGLAAAVQGDTVFVGAWGMEGGATNGKGRVYIYKKTGSNWQLSQTLFGDSSQDNFGRYIDVAGDTMAISSIQPDVVGKTGMVYIYKHNGIEWVETHVLAPTFALETSQGLFGIGIDFNEDGTVLSIGASRSDTNTGRVYVYRYNGSSWQADLPIIASDGSTGDLFGTDTAIDGNTLIVGASRSAEYGTWAGKAYMYHYNGTTWTDETILISDDIASNTFFGVSVAMEGNFIAASGPQNDNVNGSDAGAVYMFSPYPECRITTPSSVDENQSFDMSVTCSDVDEPVFGFEFAHSVDPSSPVIIPRATAYAPGDIFAAAGSNKLTLLNNTTDGYAVSLRVPEPAVDLTNPATLGSLTYDTNDPGIATLNLDLLILGNISGLSIPVTVSGSTQININDLALASISGSARRETGAVVTSAITVLTDGEPPDTTGTANGFFTFEYDEETVALDATLTVNAPGHVSCDTLDLNLTDDMVNDLTPITLLAGDVDNNDLVDITDGSIIVQERFLPGSAPVGTTPDLNEDTKINILDIIHVGRNYGTLGPSACQ